MEPFRDVECRDFEAGVLDIEERVQSLFTHRTPDLNGKWNHGDDNITIHSERFTIFCVDGKSRDFTIWYDKEAQRKSFIPNHRANAMLDAGRFTSKERINFSNNRNQVFKEYQGCNFFYGDVVCAVPTGSPGPDHSIYSNNPLASILKSREPSAESVNVYGRETAINKLIPTKKYNIPASRMIGKGVWENTIYSVSPIRCKNVEYKMLLQLWGVSKDELTRLFENLEEPQEYATSLQYTREWSELDQSDKDIIWRLRYKPGTRNSACYTPLGRDIAPEITYALVFNSKPRTPERMQFIRLMKDWEIAPETGPRFYSLDELEETIISFYKDIPAVIFYHHGLDKFTYMKGQETDESDNSDFQGELKKLRKWITDGKILSIEEGETITIGGKQLYTMEVEFKNTSCHPYFLLRRDGIMSKSTKTPYFFLVPETRANSIEWLKRRRGERKGN